LKLLKTRRGCLAIFLASLLHWILASGPAAARLPQSGSQDSARAKHADKKQKNRSMKWNPPNVDATVRSLSAAPPCELSRVLEQAGARVTELVANLQNFTASERIEYQFLDNIGDLEDGGNGTFDYLVNLEQRPDGVAIQETRTPVKGAYAFAASSADRGLPEMALIFLPRLQADYAMNCEGLGDWGGQKAWVVHFQQRKDKPSETISFSGRNVLYPAQLKGRAWIAADSGGVLHLETSLMAGIPMADVRNWSLSIDYAPVQFHSQEVTIWLPQVVDAYGESEKGRAILYHDFSNFLLFSVQTRQVIEKPKDP